MTAMSKPPRFYMLARYSRRSALSWKFTDTGCQREHLLAPLRSAWCPLKAAEGERKDAGA